MSVNSNNGTIDTFIDMNDDCAPRQMSQPFALFYTVFSIVFVVGLIGNSVLILIFARHKTMRTAPNTYIFNSALVDLITIMGCATAPLLENVGEIHHVVCKIYLVVLESAMVASGFTLTALSAERYYAIVHPLKRDMSSKRFTWWAILTIWLASISFICGKLLILPQNKCGKCVHMFNPNSFGNTYTILDFLIYITTLSIIAYFYIQIARELYFGSKSLSKESETNTAILHSLHFRRKLAGTVLVFVVMYALCYLPFNTMSMIMYLNERKLQTHHFADLTSVMFCVGCFHSCFNPFILYSLSKTFRKHFKTYLFYCIYRSSHSVETDSE